MDSNQQIPPIYSTITERTWLLIERHILQLHVNIMSRSMSLSPCPVPLESCCPWLWPFLYIFIFEPAHDKTYNKTGVTSKDSDLSVHPLSMASVLVYPSFDSLDAVEGTCDRRKLWSDCADAQADLSLRWSHKRFIGFVVRLLIYVLLVL